MDRDFMCFFYRNILPERTEVAVQGNIPYHKAEEMLREMEDELHARIDEETWNLYLKVSDLAGEAQRMLCEAPICRAQKIGSRCSDNEERGEGSWRLHGSLHCTRTRARALRPA